jgi:hypothetical protein
MHASIVAIIAKTSPNSAQIQSSLEMQRARQFASHGELQV